MSRIGKSSTNNSQTRTLLCDNFKVLLKNPKEVDQEIENEGDAYA